MTLLTRSISLMLLTLCTALPAMAADLTWGPCPVDPLPAADGTLQPTWPARGGECNLREVPLDWNNPHGATIQVFTARYRSRNPVGRLIVLDGGPGNSGIFFAPGVSPTLRRYRRQGWDLYIPTHRGVGHSTALHCEPPPPGSPEGSEASRTCLAQLEQQWGPDLAAFSVQHAARDVCDLLQSTRRRRVRTMLLGVSYGTFLAQHVVEQCPRALDGVILDGILPVSVSFDREPEVVRRIGEAALDLCRQDATCRERLPDPASAVRELFVRLEQGTLCQPIGGLLDVVNLRGLHTQAIGIGDAGPVFAMALIARLQRCHADDQRALVHLAEQLQAPSPPPSPAVFSPALSRHLLCQTAADRLSLSVPELIALESAGDFGFPNTSRLAAECAGWPRPAEPSLITLRRTSLPVLMLQARFEVNTPFEFARETAEVWNRRHQTFVEIPSGRHGLLLRDVGLPVHCAQRIAEQFLDNPRRRLDTSCTSTIGGVDFSGRSRAVRALSQMLFGTPDVWGR